MRARNPDIEVDNELPSIIVGHNVHPDGPIVPFVMYEAV